MARGGRRAGAGRKASEAGAGEPKGARRHRARGSAQILIEAALERSRGERKSRALAYLITQAGKVMEAAARGVQALSRPLRAPS